MEWWNAKKSGDEWHKLILIGIYTGLRLGDCCWLDWSQISLAQGVIQLVPRKTRRHHQRIVTIPIHQALGAALVGQQAYDSKEGAMGNRAEDGGDGGLSLQKCNDNETMLQPGNYSSRKCGIIAEGD